MKKQLRIATKLKAAELRMMKIMKELSLLQEVKVKSLKQVVEV